MLDIVIVNWNSGEQLRQCVDSVLSHDDKLITQVVIVDNGSTDGSADNFNEYPSVSIIRAVENLGFAKACNIGAKQGSAPFLLFLNPDARAEAGSLSVPLAFLEALGNENIGVCGIQLFDEDGKISRSCARFPTLGRFAWSALGLDKLPWFHGGGMIMKDWDHQSSRDVDHVIGAFYLTRRHVFDVMGGFDDRFFVYLEDVDFSQRCQAAGWDIFYLAEARAFHAGGGTSSQIKATRLYYSFRSRLMYGFKHFPRWQSWMLVGVTCFIEPLARITWCLFHADLSGALQTGEAYSLLWRNIGHIVRGEGRFKP